MRRQRDTAGHQPRRHCQFALQSQPQPTSGDLAAENVETSRSCRRHSQDHPNQRDVTPKTGITRRILDHETSTRHRRPSIPPPLPAHSATSATVDAMRTPPPRMSTRPLFAQTAFAGPSQSMRRNIKNRNYETRTGPRDASETSATANSPVPTPAPGHGASRIVDGTALTPARSGL